MKRTYLAIAMLVLPAALALLPTADAHPTCSLISPATVVTTPTVSQTVPLPGSVGASVPAQTVGGQTVGGQPIPSVTVPTLITLNGVPVLGTVVVGGQTVGGGNVPTFTVPQETVGPVGVGPVPTGLQPLEVIVHGQTVNVPVNAGCAVENALDPVSHALLYERCVVNNLRESPPDVDGALNFCQLGWP